MSYYHQHFHPQSLSNAPRQTSAPQYAGIVGQVDKPSERPIKGRSGEHWQFDLNIGDGQYYEVDINTQSKNQTPVQYAVKQENLQQNDDAFASPHYGVVQQAGVSYQQLGLQDGDFAAIADSEIDQKLQDELNSADFVAVYGQLFTDPGQQGIHDIHYNYNGREDGIDGAIAFYHINAGGQPTRTWFYFKFEEESIGQPVE